MTVQLVGTMDLPAERRGVVLDALPDHIRLTRSESGSLIFNIRIEDVHLFVQEVFTDEVAFQSHQSRIQGTEWDVVTAGLSRDYKITTLTK